jgi:hypothetical protein
MRPGIGIDDGAAVHYRDSRASVVVTTRAHADAYAVAVSEGAVSETPLEGERMHLGAG